MKKGLLFLISLFFLTFLFFTLSSNIHAAKSLGTLEGWLPKSYIPDLASTDPETNLNIISQLVSTVLGILTIVGGGISLVMFFLGSMRWLSSSGKPENIELAKSQLTYAAVGLIIVVAAYGITFILGFMFNIDILNFANYFLNLGPQGVGHIQSIAPAYDPSRGDPFNQTNLFFSIIMGGITLFGTIFFIIYFLLGSLQWLSSGGVPERIEKAKKQLTAAVIGLTILVAAYTIMFIIGTVLGINILNMGQLFSQLNTPNTSALPTAGPDPACHLTGHSCTIGGIPCCAGSCQGGTCLP